MSSGLELGAAAMALVVARSAVLRTTQGGSTNKNSGGDTLGVTFVNVDFGQYEKATYTTGDASDRAGFREDALFCNPDDFVVCVATVCKHNHKSQTVQCIIDAFARLVTQEKCQLTSLKSDVTPRLLLSGGGLNDRNHGKVVQSIYNDAMKDAKDKDDRPIFVVPETFKVSQSLAGSCGETIAHVDSSDVVLVIVPPEDGPEWAREEAARILQHAMALSRPVVVVTEDESFSPPEGVEPSGPAGWLVRGADACGKRGADLTDEIFSALNLLMVDAPLRRTMGRAAARVVNGSS